jgi:polyferredoxin
MPSRKQRRRREKARRHEWEEVWLDDEGNEIEPPADEEATKGSAKRSSATARRQGSMRQVQPPSWRRVAKRGLIFAPLMFLTVTFLSASLSVSQKILQTAFLLAFFLPFSYAMDVFMYRMFLRRGGAVGRKT